MPKLARRSRTFPLIAVVLVAALLMGGARAAPVAPSGVHPAVVQWAREHPGQPVPVIVQAAPSADPAALVRAAGGDIRSPLGLIHAVAAEVPGSRLQSLAATAGVSWVSLDAPVASTGKGSQSDALPPSVYPDEVHAPPVWKSGNRGDSIGVAVVDTGIVASGDFSSSGGASRVIASVSKDGTSGDGYGHGSFVAGLIAGNGNASGATYQGVAPAANLIDVKVGDASGTASVSDVINGLQFVLDNKDAYNIRVVNLSLRSSTAESYTTDPLDAAVELLTFRGILVVAAAGNTGTSADAVSFAPANDPFVLTVGALDDAGTGDFKDDTVPWWSSRGTTQDGFAKPELYAPGRRLISVLSPNSVLATQYPGNIVGDGYFTLSGTSTAAGVVSGVAALVFKAHPNWTPGQVKAALVQSAPSLPGESSVKVAQADKAIALKAPTDPTPNTKPNFLLLQAAGVADPAGISWGGISWGGISWGGISWGSISWGGISWGGISWGSVIE